MISAIIAEFNPFHNGHAYILEQAQKNSDAVIAIMSGNFVQRGDISIYPKHTRAEIALKNGADLIIALPAGWSMSGAENFAFGGISLIKNTKITDRIVFGAETDNADVLRKTSEFLSSQTLAESIKSFLSSGITFASARQKALEKLSAECAEILTTPNNILATEYICAMNKLNFNGEIHPIKRIGINHDSNAVSGVFTSASNIRKLILNNEDWTAFVPKNSVDILKGSDFSDFSLIDSSVIFKLRSLTLSDIQELPDISEGMENRIFEAIKTAKSVDGLCNKIKTKRYTYSRIRRIVMSAAFGIDKSFIKKEPPYIHVIGVNSRGKELLSQIKSKSDIPVIVNAKDAKLLDGFAKKVFETECVADDLYGLSFPSRKNCGTMYTEPLITVK